VCAPAYRGSQTSYSERSEFQLDMKGAQEMSNKPQMFRTVTWSRACSAMYFNSSNEGKEFLEGMYIIGYTIRNSLVLNKSSVA
jgi:hypothetical protein